MTNRITFHCELKKVVSAKTGLDKVYTITLVTDDMKTLQLGAYPADTLFTAEIEPSV